MHPPDFGAIAGLLSTITLGLICLYIYFLDRERFVGYWGIGWSLLTLRYVERMLLLDTGPVDMLFHILILASGLFLVWGTYLLVGWQFPRHWFITMGVAVVILTTITAFQVPHNWVEVLTSFVLAGTYLCTGTTIYTSKEFGTRTAKFVAIAFLFWGLHILIMPILESIGIQSAWGDVSAVMLGAASGLGFLMLYFQQVRTRLLKTNEDLSQTIEAHRNAQSALLESEERFRLLLENTNEAITVIDLDGNIQFINSVAARMFQAKPQDLVDRNYSEFLQPEELDARMKSIREVGKTGKGRMHEIQLTFNNRPRWFLASTQPVRNAHGEIHCVISVSMDISERKQMEEALRNSEENYRLVVENADEAIFIAQDGVLKFFNSRVEQLSGYSAADLANKPFIELVHPEDRAMIIARHQARLRGETDNPRYHFRLISASGQVVWFEINPIRIEWQGRPATLNFGRDLSRELIAQQALENERALAQRYLDVAGVIMLALDRQGKVTMINPRGCQVLGREENEIIGQDWVECFIPAEMKENIRLTFSRIISGDVKPMQYGRNEVLAADGSRRMIAWNNTLLRNENGEIIGTLSSGEDVTERNRAEEALQESEIQLRTLFDQAPMGIITIDKHGKVVDANMRSVEMLGSPSRESTIGLNVLKIPNLVDAGLSEKFQRVLETQQPQEFETWYASMWGKHSYFWARILPRLNGRGKPSGAVLMFDDLTDRRMGERMREVMVSISTALRAASSKLEMYPIILEQVMDLMDMEGAYLGVLDESSGGIEVVLGTGIWQSDTGKRIPAGQGISYEIIRTRQPYISNKADEDPRVFISEKPKAIRAAAALPLVAQDEIVGVIWVGRQQEINEYDMQALSALVETAASAIHRASLHEETRLRSRRLAALRTIDSAISTSFDIMPIFEVLLEAVEVQLDVDAVAIWTYSSHSQTIDFAHGRGFDHQSLRQSSLRLGQGLAGQVAVERRTIRVDDLSARQVDMNIGLLSAIPFVSYQGVPLIAKGEIKGVLEVYQQSPMETNREWLDFLNTLAGQAAIAIDNSELFNNLQVTNFELSLAYDETLEGWARALELRDMETQGHSDRVTNLTLRLAIEMGVDDSELVHIRRGALLHDIGKMGIPDQILNKPGPLNEEEWRIMKQHPEHAFRMLSPIRYLRQSLDIPYCHHEKWNGQGYPRGLKAREIPLSARLFAIVDVWDALLSDRPYRPAWTVQRALDFIKSESGKHFDPAVVDAFLKLENGAANEDEPVEPQIMPGPDGGE